MKASSVSQVVAFDHSKSTGEMVSSVWSPTAVSSGNSCYRFWSKRSSSEKTSISLIIFLVAAAITLSVLLGVFVTWYQDVSAHHDNMCTSESCVLSSASILERIDRTIDPCIDFYRFACGSFIKSNLPPLGRTERTVLQDMQDQLYIEMKNILDPAAGDNGLGDHRQGVQKVDSSDTQANKIQGKPKIHTLNGVRSIKKSINSLNSPSNDSTVATEKAKSFYKSCMKEENDDDETKSAIALIKLIESSGGQWNSLRLMSGETTIGNNVKLETHIAHSAMNQVQSIINFYVAAADKNSSHYSVHMYPGTSILDTYYLQNVTLLGDLSEEAKRYVDLQLEVIRLLAHIKNGHNISTFEAIDDMSSEQKRNYEIVRQELLDMLNFESEMAMLAKNFTLTDDTEPSPVMYTIDELNDRFNWLNWTQLFDVVAKETNVTIHELVLSDTYSGYFDLFNNTITKYNSKSIQVIHSYLSWCHVSKYIQYIGSTFKKLYSDFRKDVPEIADANSEAEPEFLFKWKECVHLTSETLKIPTTRLYIDNKYDYIIDIRHRTAQIVDSIRSSFSQIIRKQKWISNDQVKDQLIKRVQTIETRVAFPESILNSTYINLLFSNLTIDPDETLMINLMTVAFHDSLYELRRVNKTVDSDMDWLLHPIVSNAYYDETSHSMILPIGMLQKPMIMANRPKFLDYSTLGVVVGHELAHSLDKLTEGLANQTFDITANISSQVSRQFIDEYTNMTNCFIDQYSAYKVGSNWSVDGNLTLQENICDFAGLQQSYNAFEQFYIHSLFTLPGLSDYSPQQLFFIQHAQIWCEINTDDPEHDSHSPGQFRANGVLVNSRKFAQAFNCPLGSPMNPHNKCSLWSLD